MTIEELAVAAAQLSSEQKTRLLAHLSFELTIAARETYVPGTDDIAIARQIRAYNEIQHRVSACLCELLDGRKSKLWVWDVISEYAKIAGCGDAAIGACVRAFQSVENPPVVYFPRTPLELSLTQTLRVVSWSRQEQCRQSFALCA